MPLTDEDQAAITQLINDALQKATPATEQQPVTLDQIKDLFTQNANEGVGKLTAELFDQQLQLAYTQTPGFKEYLESTDEFGKARIDRLDGIEDYKTKVSTLQALQTRVATARQDNRNNEIPLTPKEKEAENEAQKKFKALDTEFENLKSEAALNEWSTRWLEQVFEDVGRFGTSH